MKNRQPSDGWTEIDKKLVVAFQILEDETCPDCGVPMWIGHSDSNEVVFKVKSRVCYSCAEIESAKETAENRKGKRRPTKGKKNYIITEPSKNMPTREQYLMEINNV